MSDQEYIKMILALDKEVFEDWEWQAGDRAITLTSHREIMIISTPLRLKLVKMRNPQNCGWIEAIFPESDDITHEMFKISDLRLIPSQEQLQEMVKNHMIKDDETVLDYDIINFFCDWFKAHFCSKSTYKEIEHSSIKSVWLRYAMHIIYSKKWNGDSWEKTT